MPRRQKPVEPVQPSGMEIFFFYECPFCHASIPVQATSQPMMLRCLNCQNTFPIIPADQSFLNFLRIMTNDGRAAADSEFL